MARRRQTSGLPKKSRQDKSEPPQKTSLFDRLLGNPITRAEREEALNKFLQRVSFGTLSVVAAIIIVTLIYQLLIVPNFFTVATVNGQGIPVHEFRERVGFERGMVLQGIQSKEAYIRQFVGPEGDLSPYLEGDQQYQQWVREWQVVDILGQRVLDDMIDDAVIRQEAAARNITVNNEAVQNEINEFFGYDPTEVALIGTPATETPVPTETATPFVSPTPSPTPFPTATATATPEATEAVEGTAEATPDVEATATLPASPTPSQEDMLQQFEDNVDFFRQYIRDSGRVSDAAVDAFFQRQALRNALMDAIVSLDEMATYVSARQILAESEEEANEILAALQNGEPFALLAQARSLDTNSSYRGGELGDFPAGFYSTATGEMAYLPELATALLQANIGDTIGPIQTEYGYHIIQVRSREEREVEEFQRDSLREAEFQHWLDNLREQYEANISINDSWPNFLTTN